MNAGRELDALIAEKVMGVDPREIYPLDYQRVGPDGDEVPFLDREEVLDEVLHYSTDIAAAWEVVEKLHLSVGAVQHNGKWEWLVCPDTNWADERCEFASTAPLAICLVARNIAEGPR
jgi:hypothetical protein